MTTAVLTLNRDCPWNTTITDFNGVTQYDVSTSAHKSELRTVVRNHRDETIATLQWRDFLPDRIELGGRSMMVDQWLTKSIVPLK
jgi:hypothetical protein